MKSLRVLNRALLPMVLAGVLAGCQTVPPTAPATPQTPADTVPPATTQPVPAPVETEQQARQREPVAVLLADTVEQEGWMPVAIQSGTLYVNPQPVITHNDLVDVDAGRGPSGQGLLALTITPEAQTRLEEATAQFPNKRLALVVGRTMLAAPGYSTPVDTNQLVFPVGTEQNAAAAVRAITGDAAQ